MVAGSDCPAQARAGTGLRRRRPDCGCRQRLSGRTPGQPAAHAPICRPAPRSCWRGHPEPTVCPGIDAHAHGSAGRSAAFRAAGPRRGRLTPAQRRGRRNAHAARDGFCGPLDGGSGAASRQGNHPICRDGTGGNPESHRATRRGSSPGADAFRRGSRRARRRIEGRKGQTALHSRRQSRLYRARSA